MAASSPHPKDLNDSRPDSHQNDAHRLVREANERYHAYVADDYEKAHASVFDASSPVHQRLRRHLDRLAVNRPGGSYLDLGCGTGALLADAQKRFGDIAGVDISPAMLRQARDRSLPVIKGDLLQLPFADETFDAVTCMSVLHHLHRPEPTLAEMVRVLKPGGMLVTDHDPSNRFILKWPKVNRLFRKFFRHEEFVGQHFEQRDGISPEEWQRIELTAEYHAGPGFDPERLIDFLHHIGCSTAHAEYHFLGDLPGRIVDILGTLRLERGWPVVAPYFSLIAIKNNT